jgi:hypothetical protein
MSNALMLGINACVLIAFGIGIGLVICRPSKLALMSGKSKFGMSFRFPPGALSQSLMSWLKFKVVFVSIVVKVEGEIAVKPKRRSIFLRQHEFDSDFVKTQPLPQT